MDSQQQSSFDDQLAQEEQKKIKRQLKNVPYSVLLKIQDQMQKSKEVKKDQKQNIKNKQIINKSLRQTDKDKNAPKQIPILKRPPRKKPGIDPRFEAYAGKYDQDMAMKAYQFVPKIQNQQVKQIKKFLSTKKIKQNQKQILQKKYNNLTSDIKRVQIDTLKREVYRKQKKKIISNNDEKKFYPKKKMLKEQFERVKMINLTQINKQKKIKKKQRKIQKIKMIDRKQIIK